MIKNFRNVFNIPELKRKLIYTFLLLIVYRLGAHIPTAGINSSALAAYFESLRQSGGTVLGLMDMFSGGALSKATIFALGIMPYISASIIIQLLTAVLPFFEKLKKEGEEGKKKMTQYTRYGTVLLAMVQGYAISFFLESLPPQNGIGIVINPGFGFKILTMITLTAGTVFIMWLGERITENGIGNGISLIIFANIISRFLPAILNTIQSLEAFGGELQLIPLFIIAVMMIGIIAFTIILTQGTRKITVQYPKKVVGRKIYAGQNTHIPLKINTAGVIPVIFAQSIIMFPGTIAAFFKDSDTMQSVAALFTPGAILHTVLYTFLIVFFAYFYTAIVFNPVDLAENMRKHGGFIPGIRAGKRTAEFLDNILTRITLPGSIALAFLAVLPFFMIKWFNVPFWFGGTALLIVVGVALDTLSQIESHLIVRHYDSFMKKGRIRGRR